MTRPIVTMLILAWCWQLAAQQVVKREECTVKTLKKSSRSTYIGRTTIYEYHLQVLKADSSWGTNIGTENGGIKQFAFSDDEKLVAFGTYYGFVEVWQIAPRQLLWAQQLHQGQVNDVKFLDGDARIASCGVDGFIKVADVQTGSSLQTLSASCIIDALEADATRHGTLISGDHDGNIIVWDIMNQKMIKKWHAHDSYILDLEFHPVSKRIFSAGHDRIIKLWGLDAKLIQEFSGHQRAVYTLDLDDTGTLLASGGMDNIVRVWNVASGKEVQQLHGHTDYVMAVCMLPDYSILSGSRDFTLRQWRLIAK